MLPATIVAGSYIPTRVKKELDWDLPIQLGARRMAAKRVQEWLSLAGFSIVIDSDFGPATEQRVRDFQTRKGIPATGSVDAATHERLVQPLVAAIAPISTTGKTLSKLTLEYALQHVAQHPLEVGGPNCGPWVRAYMDADGEAWKWCSGFICFALEQAATSLDIRQPIPSSASVDAMSYNAQAKGLFVKESKVKSGAFPKNKILPGSFFLVRSSNTDWTHIGIVSKAETDTFDTVEGNTDSNGSSNGFEATTRVRGYMKKDFIVW